MRLRRGFRKEAEEYAAEFRHELGLEIADPLSPFALAEHLSVPVVPLSALEGLDSQHLNFVRHDVGNTFSATTVAEGTFKLIVHNDFHHPVRQNSDVMHEIAHILLGHPPRPPLSGDGCRNFDSVAENEANQLGFALLIPKRAALKIVESKMSIAAAAALYGVSAKLLIHRLNITDAKGWANSRQRFGWQPV